jgi:hypothetical protein
LDDSQIYFLSNDSRSETIIESIKLKSIAHPNPSTLNPPNNASAISIIAALIIKVNKPRVRKLIGKAKNMKIGFTKVCNKISTIATTINSPNPPTWTPGSILLAIKIPIA